MGLQQAKLESLPVGTGELNYLAPTPGNAEPPAAASGVRTSLTTRITAGVGTSPVSMK